jgi:hypothetical protein
MPDLECRRMIGTGHFDAVRCSVRARQLKRVRRSLGRALAANHGRPDKKMKHAGAAFAFRNFEQDVIRHRLSWFATVQGLLFISFALIDKSQVILTSVLVCAGIAMCLPAIASAYTSPRLKNWMRLLLAVFWVTIGVAQFVLRPI